MSFITYRTSLTFLTFLTYNTSVLTFFPSRAVALSLGSFSIHWYGLMYALAFVIGSFVLPSLLRLRSLSLTPRDRESLLLHIFFGVIIGGRLGYFLFYGFSYYIAHPLHIVAVWEGGMSSHGGFIGVALLLFLYARKHRIDPLALADTLMVPVAIGLALGRLGNFINGELYGTVTALPWGMYFPDVDGLRHPTQIYAIIKDLVLATVSFLHLRTTSIKFVPGRTTSYFLMIYAVFRSLVEIFRDQPFGFVTLGSFSLSWGQIYTIPLFVVGAVLWLVAGSLSRWHRA